MDKLLYNNDRQVLTAFGNAGQIKDDLQPARNKIANHHESAL